MPVLSGSFQETCAAGRVSMNDCRSLINPSISSMWHMLSQSSNSHSWILSSHSFGTSTPCCKNTGIESGYASKISLTVVLRVTIIMLLLFLLDAYSFLAVEHPQVSAKPESLLRAIEA